MIKVTVASPALRVQPYTSKKTGQPAELHFQTVYLHTIDSDGNPCAFPEKVEIFAQRDAHGDPKGYPKGEYQMHPSSVFVDRDGRPAVSLRLTPLGKAGGTV